MKSPKRITYITYQTFPANTANSLQTISNIKYLIKNGIQVNLIFPLRSKDSNDSLEGINKHYGENLNFELSGIKHKYPFGKFKYFNKFFFLISHYLWSRNITKNIDSSAEDKYYFTRSDWVFYFLSKKKMSVVFECHQYTKIRKMIINISLKNKRSKVIFLNENLKNDYEQKYKLKNNYSILQNGVDAELFTNNRKKKNQIVFVGKLTRFGQPRNIEFILKSFSKLNNSYHLKIVGATESELKTYNKIVNDLELSDRIELMGYVTHREVVRHVCESEIGILLNSNLNSHSVKYTSPLKYFEYLCADVKVIAPDFPAHQILPFSENISFYKLENEKSFVEAVTSSKLTKLLNESEKERISLNTRAKEIINLFL
tara:strand:+ start:4414 stop:5529 length:1116 start_codon:yes stop_codon:yes gene_type:complete